jgi:hypothetical protein
LYRRLSPAGRRFHPRGGLPLFATIRGETRADKPSASANGPGYAPGLVRQYYRRLNRKSGVVQDLRRPLPNRGEVADLVALDIRHRPERHAVLHPVHDVVAFFLAEGKAAGTDRRLEGLSLPDPNPPISAHPLGITSISGTLLLIGARTNAARGPRRRDLVRKHLKRS